MGILTIVLQGLVALVFLGSGSSAPRLGIAVRRAKPKAPRRPAPPPRLGG